MSDENNVRDTAEGPLAIEGCRHEPSCSTFDYCYEQRERTSAGRGKEALDALEEVICVCAPDRDGVYDRERQLWQVEELARSVISGRPALPYPGPRTAEAQTVAWCSEYHDAGGHVDGCPGAPTARPLTFTMRHFGCSMASVGVVYKHASQCEHQDESRDYNTRSGYRSEAGPCAPAVRVPGTADGSNPVDGTPGLRHDLGQPQASTSLGLIASIRGSLEEIRATAAKGEGISHWEDCDAYGCPEECQHEEDEDHGVCSCTIGMLGHVLETAGDALDEIADASGSATPSSSLARLRVVMLGEMPDELGLDLDGEVGVILTGSVEEVRKAACVLLKDVVLVPADQFTSPAPKEKKA